MSRPFAATLTICAVTFMAVMVATVAGNSQKRYYRAVCEARSLGNKGQHAKTWMGPIRRTSDEAQKDADAHNKSHKDAAAFVLEWEGPLDKDEEKGLEKREKEKIGTESGGAGKQAWAGMRRETGKS